MRAIVTGATGFVGSHLVDALLERGDHLTCLVRASSRTDRLRGTSADLRIVSLHDAAGLRDAVTGADVVFHVAGRIKAIDAHDYARDNVEATRTLAQACRDALPRPRRLVLVSSQAAAGPGWPDRARTEDDAEAPVSAYGWSKLGGEREVKAVADAIEVAIVRPSVVYGPRDSAVRPLFRIVGLGLAPRMPVNLPISLIHVHDLVACLLRAGDQPAASGRVYFASGPAATINHLTGLIARSLGRRSIPIPVPAVALVAAGAAADAVAWLSGRSRPFGRQKAREMLHTSWVCSPERAARELGFRATILPEIGIPETAHWYRDNGWL